MIRALKGEPVERPPVWIMRQAGRYLSQYRALKETYGFVRLCKTPELAAEVTLQPISTLDPDAAIIFSDILLLAESLGIQVDFAPGPKIANPIRTTSDIAALRQPRILTDLNYVFQALSLVKGELAQQEAAKERKALLGFSGAPWTLACYLIAPGPYKSFEACRIFAYQDPTGFAMLMQKLTDAVSEYLLAQIESGADAVQLFDTWAGNLNLEDYRALVLPYTQQIFQSICSSGRPSILYVNGCSHLLEALKDSGATCISLDWRTDLRSAQQVLGPTLALQGNLDPSCLYAAPEVIARQTQAMLSKLQRRSKYIANLGHGILQKTPPEHARIFIDTIKQGWAPA